VARSNHRLPRQLLVVALDQTTKNRQTLLSRLNQTFLQFCIRYYPSAALYFVSFQKNKRNITYRYIINPRIDVLAYRQGRLLRPSPHTSALPSLSRRQAAKARVIAARVPTPAIGSPASSPAAIAAGCGVGLTCLRPAILGRPPAYRSAEAASLYIARPYVLALFCLGVLRLAYGSPCAPRLGWPPRRHWRLVVRPFFPANPGRAAATPPLSRPPPPPPAPASGVPLPPLPPPGRGLWPGGGVVVRAPPPDPLFRASSLSVGRPEKGVLDSPKAESALRAGVYFTGTEARKVNLFYGQLKLSAQKKRRPSTVVSTFFSTPPAFK